MAQLAVKPKSRLAAESQSDGNRQKIAENEGTKWGFP
jgi:hypothetical protein